MTDFENIEINDATGTPRKVAGEFVTQGADDLFHQTAISLPHRLDEGNIATLDSTGTTIALSGFETHVLFDFNSLVDENVRVGLRYFAGGRLYPADLQFGIPQVLAVGGIDSREVTGTSILPEDRESFSDGTSGQSLLFVPTRGAIELFIETDSGSIPDVDYALLVMPPTHVFATTTEIKRRMSRFNNITASAQPYAAGDAIGTLQDAYIWDSYLGSSQSDRLRAAPLLTSFRYRSGVDTGPATWDAPDVDVYIWKANEGPSATDGAAYDPTTLNGFTDLIALLQFRESPGQGQYRSIDTSRGFVGEARDLAIPVFEMVDTGFGLTHWADIVVVYQGGSPLAVNNSEGLGVDFTFELS